MIKKRDLAVLVALIFAFFSISCNKFTGETAATIDGKKITIEEVNKFYYIQNKLLTNIDSNEEIDKLAENPAYANHPFLNKANFLDHLIAQKVLYEKAMEDKEINKDELKALLEMVKMQTAAQYYLSKKLKNKISVSDDEVNKIYNENRARFAGRTADESENYIKQQLFAQKSRVEADKLVREILAEHSIKKDGFKEYLEKNKKSAPSEENKAETVPAQK
jgi:tellurite resistance protein